MPLGSVYMPGCISFSSKEGAAAVGLVVVVVVAAVVVADAVVFAAVVAEVFGAVVMAVVLVAPAVQPESNIIIKLEARNKPGSILFLFMSSPFSGSCI